MHPDVKALIDHFRFSRIPLEGTLYKRTYKSPISLDGGVPSGTAMIGMYCREPSSGSTFHRVSSDEVWHFYKGDPFSLYLLYEDGSSREVVMGNDVLAGEFIQFTVPAGVWQAGCLLPGSEYALFGCTMTPGFTGNCFESAVASELIEKYPDQQSIITKLALSNGEKKLPDGYDG